MNPHDLVLYGLFLATAGVGFVHYQLLVALRGFHQTISQLPKHLKEGTEVPTSVGPANSGDVRMHIPNSLFGDRDDFKELPPSLR